MNTGRFLFIFFGFFFACSAFAQSPPPTEHYWTFGFNLGTFGWSPTTSSQLDGNDHFTRVFGGGVGLLTDVSGRQHFSIDANTTGGISAGFLFRDGHTKQFSAVQAEFQLNRAIYEFDPPFHFTVQSDSFARWVMTDRYMKYAVAFQQCIYRGPSSGMGGESFFYVRESFGQTFYHRNFTDRVQQGHFEDWTDHGTGMTSTTVKANATSLMLGSEIGIRSFSQDHSRTLDFGIVFYAPFTASYTERYEFFRNGASSGKSDVTFNGSTIMLNLRYSFDVKGKIKAIDTTSYHPKDMLVHVDTSGRKMEVQSTFTAHGRTVKVKVWDNDEVDGDSITLFLNGQIVKEHVSLKRRKKTFRVHLDPGDNYLMMYAENLGTTPPNTAAVEIKEGMHKRRVVLVSDKGKSGAVKIVR
ncbi:MAG TPA: hypothetical protein VFU15_08065 [Bacteroidia bacterium]|nr:hypothetical protein [Bacteroidia bacterium]